MTYPGDARRIYNLTTTRHTKATKPLEVKHPGIVRQNGHNDNKVSRIDVLSYGAHDDGNAECMKDLYGERLIYSEALGWKYYTGTHWKDVSRAKAIQLATETLKIRLDTAIRANNESLMRATLPTRSNISDCVILYQSKVTVEDVSIFDSDPDLLNCLNGVVNLRTGSIEPHKSCQYLTYCIPIEYRRDADMSLWNDFIHQCADSEEVAHFLQMAVGYSFTGHTREEKFFYLYGPTRAGKGTFTETLKYLLGTPFADIVQKEPF